MIPKYNYVYFSGEGDIWYVTKMHVNVKKCMKIGGRSDECMCKGCTLEW